MYNIWYIRKGEQIYGRYDNGTLSMPLRSAPEEMKVQGKDTGYGRMVESGVNKLICFEIDGEKYYAWAWRSPKDEVKKPWWNMGEGMFKGNGLGLGNRKQGMWLIIIIIAYAIYKIAKR